jgi:hypothetical protein
MAERSGSQTRSEARIVAALVATAWLVATAPMLLGGRTLASEPHLASTVPWFDRLGTAVSDGYLPEWDDATGLGAPVATEVGRPLCYPPAWLVAALPGAWGVDALLLAHLLFFGLGAAMWARRMGADPMGAVIAGSAAALSAAMIGALTEGGAVCAAAWLPWLGWAADRLADGVGLRRAVAGALVLALLLASLLLAAGGLAGPALVAPAVIAAALLARVPRQASTWIALAAAVLSALLLSAVAWLPAAAAGQLWPGDVASGPVFHPAEIPALVLALWGAVAGPTRVRRVAAAAAALIVLAFALPLGADGFPVAAASLLAPLAGVGATRAWLALDRIERLVRWRATAGALLATAAIGPLAARAWGLPFEPRDSVERPPALLAAAAERAAGAPRRRIAWPDHPHRAYRDAPPDSGARFGFAYVPGRDRARDPLLAEVWRASSGAAERLLDLYDVEYAVVPATVAVPAAMPVEGQSADGERVLARNQQRRARAFVAPRWSWHGGVDQLMRDLFPSAPDQRGSVALAHTRLLASGDQPRPPSSSARAVEPAPPCAIASTRPEEVELTCRSSSGGYAVLLDRAAVGWSAEVDGRPAAIATADLLARAVAIGPGRHVVSFRYSTPGLRLGAALSAAAWLNAAALALLLLRLRGHERASVVPTEPG